MLHAAHHLHRHYHRYREYYFKKCYHLSRAELIGHLNEWNRTEGLNKFSIYFLPVFQLFNKIFTLVEMLNRLIQT